MKHGMKLKGSGVDSVEVTLLSLRKERKNFSLSQLEADKLT